MPETTRKRLMAAWCGILMACAARTDEGKPDLARSLNATSPARQPLNLLLTRSELLATVRNYEARTGEIHTTPISDEEVEVRAPPVLAPMRDASQDAWGGIAAPFWAIMHPKDAWRIFVPIPPKGEPRESEKPVPDPR